MRKGCHGNHIYMTDEVLFFLGFPTRETLPGETDLCISGIGQQRVHLLDATGRRVPKWLDAN